MNDNDIAVRPGPEVSAAIDAATYKFEDAARGTTGAVLPAIGTAPGILIALGGVGRGSTAAFIPADQIGAFHAALADAADASEALWRENPTVPMRVASLLQMAEQARKEAANYTQQAAEAEAALVAEAQAADAARVDTA